MDALDVYRRALAQALAVRGTGQSLPLLVKEDGEVRLAFVIFPIMVRLPEGKIVYPPTHVATFRLDDGELVELRHAPMGPARGEGPDGSLGVERMPDGYDYASYVAARDRLMTLLHALAGPFGGAPLPGTAGDAAAEALRLYDALCDPLLRPFLHQAAPELFGWLDSTRTR